MMTIVHGKVIARSAEGEVHEFERIPLEYFEIFGWKDEFIENVEDNFFTFFPFRGNFPWVELGSEFEELNQEEPWLSDERKNFQADSGSVEEDMQEFYSLPRRYSEGEMEFCEFLRENSSYTEQEIDAEIVEIEV